MDDPNMDGEHEAGEELESPAFAALRPLLETGGYMSGQESDDREYDENSDACSIYSGATLDGFDWLDLDSEDESFSASVVVEKKSELEEAMELNQTYQDLLQSLIEDLYDSLLENRQMQVDLSEHLVKRMSQRDQPRPRKNWNHPLVFHYPYFRDVNGMRAPMNEDERVRRANKEMDPYIVPKPAWTTEENHMLVHLLRSPLGGGVYHTGSWLRSRRKNIYRRQNLIVSQ